MQRYCHERQQAGVLLRGIRIEIHAVKTHPVDTYEQGVERLAFAFMYDVERASEEIVGADGVEDGRRDCGPD
jgi:hypothetical protein